MNQLKGDFLQKNIKNQNSMENLTEKIKEYCECELSLPLKNRGSLLN